MPGATPTTEEGQTATLARATQQQYGEFARGSTHNEFWWYFNGGAPYRGFSRPFADDHGRWWYRVKPGFAWPVDFFRTLESNARPGRATLLGWQFPAAPEHANSFVPMNVIHSLGDYSVDSVAQSKRRAVRKGLRGLTITVLDPANPLVCGQACEVWNSHVARTGWNRVMDAAGFSITWKELAVWPGTTVLGAFSKDAAPLLCAWLIARVIDDTVFVDTIASHTDRLADRPNDAMIFTCLISAKLQGIAHAHYSLCSDIASLEEFKRSLGFVPHRFPCRLHLRLPVRLGLKCLRPRVYRRLLGEPLGSGAA